MSEYPIYTASNAVRVEEIHTLSTADAMLGDDPELARAALDHIREYPGSDALEVSDALGIGLGEAVQLCQELERAGLVLAGEEEVAV